MIDGTTVEITEKLVAAYHDKPLPRYTSYPPIPRWEALGPEPFRGALASLEGAVSLYLHVPFCRAKCRFCGCSSIATGNLAIRERYLAACRREIDLVAGLTSSRVRIGHLHFGGGTPLSLGRKGIGAIIDRFRACFQMAESAECAIELDPRGLAPQDVADLAGMGFNRMSFGVQDFDAEVARIIGRESSFRQVALLVEAARSARVESVNIDLIHGLPGQRAAGWAATLGQVLELSPDRIALFPLAFLPRRLPHQRAIDPAFLPQGARRLELFTMAVERFEGAGYAFIGLDHFAKEGDPLAHAAREGRLTRNFQGYVAAARPIIGIGATAISELSALYAQNEKRLIRYLKVVEGGAFATFRGCLLPREDEMRRAAIRKILCGQSLSRNGIAREWGMPFDEAFPGAAGCFRKLARDGLVEDDGDRICATPLGRLFLRFIAAAFDPDRDGERSEGSPA